MATADHHPGGILAQRLKALDLSPTKLTRQLHVPANHISQIVNNQRGSIGDSALRLGHWYDNASEFWMALQSLYDLEIAKAEAEKAGAA